MKNYIAAKITYWPLTIRASAYVQYVSFHFLRLVRRHHSYDFENKSIFSGKKHHILYLTENLYPATISWKWVKMSAWEYVHSISHEFLRQDKCTISVSVQSRIHTEINTRWLRDILLFLSFATWARATPGPAQTKWFDAVKMIWFVIWHSIISKPGTYYLLLFTIILLK